MANTNDGARREGERFKSWLERVIPAIYRRVTTEMADIAGLQADADTLATVIPELASALSAQSAALVQKEADLQAAIDAKTADDAEKAKLEGELAQVQAIKAELDPVVKQASDLVPAPAGGGGEPAGGTEPAGGAPGGEPLAPPPGETGATGPGGTIPGGTV